MPLSEHEQRLLEQLERQLHAEDPRLASTLADQRPAAGVGVRRLVAGVALAVVGLAVVVLGVSLHQILVGVLGAVVVGAGIFVLTSRGRAATGAPAARPARRAGAGRGLMARLEQDWDERRRSQD